MPQRFVRRVLERPGAGRDRNDLRAHQLHAVYVEPLAPHVFFAHVNHTVETESRADGCRGHAVLACAGLGDDAALVHALRQQHLPQRVVDLVRARVVQVLALEQHRDSDLRGQARHRGDGRRTTHVILEQIVELAPELRIVAGCVIHGRQLLERVHQRLGDVAAPIRAESSAGYVSHGRMHLSRASSAVTFHPHQRAHCLLRIGRPRDAGADEHKVSSRRCQALDISARLDAALGDHRDASRNSPYQCLRSRKVNRKRVEVPGRHSQVPK